MLDGNAELPSFMYGLCFFSMQSGEHAMGSNVRYSQPSVLAVFTFVGGAKAPEIISDLQSDTSYYGQPADIYSFAM